MSERRLPIYLLLDVSGSMNGAPIQSVNEGLCTFSKTIKSDAPSLETIHVSVITFGGDVNQVCSMVPAEEFTPPTLKAEGSTPLGEALIKLNECLENEVHYRTGISKADYKPIVFLFTDGYPTDGEYWKQGMEALNHRTNAKLVNFIAIGTPSADMEFLSSMGGTTMRMASLNRENIQELFKWISQSTTLASVSASQIGIGGTLALPAPPPCIEIIH